MGKSLRVVTRLIKSHRAVRGQANRTVSMVRRLKALSKVDEL
jgi:hypothetical protein